MKDFQNRSLLLSFALCAFLIIGISSRLNAQEDVYIKLANFSILVETVGDEIQLTCDKGCD